MYVVLKVSNYDAILGCHFLQKVEISLDFNNQLITCNNVSTSMKKPKNVNNFNYAIEEIYILQADDPRRI